MALSSSEISNRQNKFAEGLAWCTKCMSYLPVSKFYKLNGDRHENFGLRYHCVDCNKSRGNKNDTLQNAKQRNHALKKYWVTLMGGKCQRCGYNEFYSSFDFHHVSPSEKEDNPAKTIYGGDKELAKLEIDKCCLLCRNCHQSYTSGLWQGEFIKAELGYELKSHWLSDAPKNVAVYQTPTLFNMRKLWDK